MLEVSSPCTVTAPERSRRLEFYDAFKERNKGGIRGRVRSELRSLHKHWQWAALGSSCLDILKQFWGVKFKKQNPGGENAASEVKLQMKKTPPMTVTTIHQGRSTLLRVMHALGFPLTATWMQNLVAHLGPRWRQFLHLDLKRLKCFNLEQNSPILVQNSPILVQNSPILVHSQPYLSHEWEVSFHWAYDNVWCLRILRWTSCAKVSVWSLVEWSSPSVAFLLVFKVYIWGYANTFRNDSRQTVFSQVARTLSNVGSEELHQIPMSPQKGTFL